jgi:LysM repeat protein
MKLTCTKGMFFMVLALLLLGAAACTQQKPNIPTPTLVVLSQPPVLVASTPEGTSVPVGTAPAGTAAATSVAITPQVPTEAATSGALEPTLLPTPTSGVSTSVPQAPATQVPSSGGGTTGGACPSRYTVQSGDWAYQIARKCGVSYQALVAANPSVNLGTVYAGQVLTIPGGGAAPSGGSSGGGSPSGRTYVVKPGDTLYSIARNFGVTVAALASLNGIPAPYNNIYAGQVLQIP